MSAKTIETIMVNNLVQRYNANPDIFNALPEFSFIGPLAAKIKAKGCTCGLGGELHAANEVFNMTVSHLNDEQVSRMKTLLGVESLYFGIQNQNGFELKSY